MNDRSGTLNDLGWNDWFERRADCQLPDHTVARVAAVDRDQWLLIDPSGPFRAKLAGIFRHRQTLSHQLPCVGDWVCLERQPGGGLGVIHALLARRTCLRRKSVGNVTESQMIAANVDFVLIVQSCSSDFNLKRLERYLVMVSDGGAEPLILLTKTDLVDPSVLTAQSAAIRSAGITAPILSLSNVTLEGVEDLKRQLVSGKTYCFVGSSGVGKSTLINQLIGRGLLDTKDVSGTGEGRHTTVRRELIRLQGGALVIDNPGMRELGIPGADEGLESRYADITALASGCRYRNCRHSGEPGCAVTQAVESGELSQAHFDNYLKLKGESEFYEMSYAEKRKRDRNFGKFIKSVKKHLADDQ